MNPWGSKHISILNVILWHKYLEKNVVYCVGLSVVNWLWTVHGMSNINSILVVAGYDSIFQEEKRKEALRPGLQGHWRIPRNETGTGPLPWWVRRWHSPPDQNTPRCQTKSQVPRNLLATGRIVRQRRCLSCPAQAPGHYLLLAVPCWWRATWLRIT
jgi:hypothetical protein